MDSFDDKKDDKKDKKNLIVGVIIAVVVLILVVVAGWWLVASVGGLSPQAAAAKAETYINTELLGGQGSAKVSYDSTVSGVYKLKVEYNGQTITSYITKDGKEFFPQAMDIAPAKSDTRANADSNQNVPATTVSNKTDKPTVELFVMSYCPYGTQIEKGIIPAVQALGSKIDFKLKFVYYTMHGDKENQENLRQYCIEKEQNSKFFSYLTCFLKASDSAGCLKSSGVDEKKLSACTSAATKQYKVTGTDFNIYQADNDKYGVQGSPTLVVNGTTVSSGRDSANLLKTICSAFKTAPAECQKQLSSATPSAGFGEGTAASSGSAAGCATN
jgi:glutaredoxin